MVEAQIPCSLLELRPPEGKNHGGGRNCFEKLPSDTVDQPQGKKSRKQEDENTGGQ